MNTDKLIDIELKLKEIESKTYFDVLSNIENLVYDIENELELIKHLGFQYNIMMYENLWDRIFKIKQEYEILDA